jgi:hypothetical protein
MNACVSPTTSLRYIERLLDLTVQYVEERTRPDFA